MDNDPARIEDESEVEAHSKRGRDAVDEGGTDDAKGDDFELQSKRGRDAADEGKSDEAEPKGDDFELHSKRGRD